MMKIKAVLFDLDNTLIDFMKMKRLASNAAASAMVDAGLDAEKKELAEELFAFYRKNGIESDDVFERFLLEKYGKADLRVLAAGINAYLKEKYMHMKPYPGVKEVLSELKGRGLKLGVVSDGLRLKAWMRLNEAGIDRFFGVVIAFEDTNKKKPSPEPFRKALGELKVKPEECLFVGDWPEKDIKGAKDLGMKTCFARYGCLRKEVSCDAEYCIDDIGDILSIVGL